MPSLRSRPPAKQAACTSAHLGRDRNRGSVCGQRLDRRRLRFWPFVNGLLGLEHLREVAGFSPPGPDISAWPVADRRSPQPAGQARSSSPVATMEHPGCDTRSSRPVELVQALQATVPAGRSPVRRQQLDRRHSWRDPLECRQRQPYYQDSEVSAPAEWAGSSSDSPGTMRFDPASSFSEANSAFSCGQYSSRTVSPCTATYGQGGKSVHVPLFR